MVSANAQYLVRLQAETPARMREAIVHGVGRIALARRTVHRLQEEVREFEPLVALRLCAGLGEYELELVAALERERRVSLRADADPVDAGGGRQCAVGLDRNPKAECVQRLQQRGVELQQGLAARAHHEATRRGVVRPQRADARGKRPRVLETPAAGAVDADEIGVAEAAHRAGAVGLAPAPQVAAGEAAEHGGPACVCAFALQRIEDLLDAVHSRPRKGRDYPLSATLSEGKRGISMAQYVYTMRRVGKIVPPQRVILKNISLNFFPGAKIGVLGLNGSGKSTLLRIMAGVDDNYEGEVVRMPGIKVGYLEQEPALPENITVREAVEAALGDTAAAKKRL